MKIKIVAIERIEEKGSRLYKDLMLAIHKDAALSECGGGGGGAARNRFHIRTISRGRPRSTAKALVLFCQETSEEQKSERFPIGFLGDWRYNPRMPMIGGR